MKSARLNQTGIATPSIAATLPVIASEARQSSALVGQSGLPRRFAPRKDDGGGCSMKLGRLNHIGVAGPLSYSVFASVAKQSRLLDVMLDCRVAALLAKTIGVFSGAGLPRFVRNDDRVRQ